MKAPDCIGERRSRTISVVSICLSIVTVAVSIAAIPNHIPVAIVHGVRIVLVLLWWLFLPMRRRFSAPVFFPLVFVFFGLLWFESVRFLPRVLDWALLPTFFFSLEILHIFVWTALFAYYVASPASWVGLGAVVWLLVVVHGRMQVGGRFLYLFLLAAVTGVFVASRLFARVAQQHRREAELVRELEHTQVRVVEQERISTLAAVSAGLLHELLNPVHHMKGNLPFLKEDIDRLTDLAKDTAAARTVADDAHAIVSRIEEGTDRIRDVLETFRSIGRDGVEDDRDEFSPAELVTLVVRRIRSELPARTEPLITFSVESAEDAVVVANRRDLEIVLNAVIQNAVDAILAAGRKGQVTIGLRTSPDGTRITVTDTGDGIAPEAAEHLFDPFFTTKGSGGNLGIGLNVCRRLMGLHGGTIEVHGTEGGTTVDLFLPGKAER
ncbi:MAG: sensor histidine kinase [Alkalispirochaeta sp.]